MKKKTKKEKYDTALLIAHNGFSRRMRFPEGTLPLMIKIPFSYRLRVSDPLVGDYMDLNVSPVGEFRLQKRTERTGIYQLGNLYQAKENP